MVGYRCGQHQAGDGETATFVIWGRASSGIISLCLGICLLGLGLGLSILLVGTVEKPKSNS